MSELSDLGRGSKSDKPGRRYFSAKSFVKAPLNYDQPSNKEDREELSRTFEQNTICGTAIPMQFTELKRNPNDSALDFIAPEDARVLAALEEETATNYNGATFEDVLEDTGMHILNPNDDYNPANDFNLD